MGDCPYVFNPVAIGGGVDEQQQQQHQPESKKTRSNEHEIQATTTPSWSSASRLVVSSSPVTLLTWSTRTPARYERSILETDEQGCIWAPGKGSHRRTLNADDLCVSLARWLRQRQGRRYLHRQREGPRLPLQEGQVCSPASEDPPQGSVRWPQPQVRIQDAPMAYISTFCPRVFCKSKVY